ncbi:hypothetical protein [Lentibacter algarum]|uniref:hypothetical protein n=1 Tax=Lentibacter algarum TaxID=576131 RepID=UPI001C0658C2|nr:hypothetical protein [Lentibacter algarum]
MNREVSDLSKDYGLFAPAITHMQSTLDAASKEGYLLYDPQTAQVTSFVGGEAINAPLPQDGVIKLLEGDKELFYSIPERRFIEPEQ